MATTNPKKPARRAPQALAAKPVAGKPVTAKPMPAKPIPAASAAPSAASAPPVAKAAAKPAAARPAPAKPAPAAHPTPAPIAKPAKVAPVASVDAATLPAPVELPPVRSSSVPVADVASLAAAVTAAIPPEVLPKAVRGVADTGLTQARDAYATLKHSAESLSSGLNTSGEAAARGLKSLSATMLEQMQTNADATLGFLRAMAGVKTLSEAIELQARHARLQFDTVTAQAKALAGIVNKTATETAEPMRKAFDASLRRAS